MALGDDSIVSPSRIDEDNCKRPECDDYACDFVVGARMETIAYYFWLALDAIRLAILVLPVHTFIGGIGLAAAMYGLIKTPPYSLTYTWKWLMLPFTIPAVILAIGVIYRNYAHMNNDTLWPLLIIDGLIWLHIPIGIVLAVVMQRSWLVAVGLSVFQLWLSYSFGAACHMSITNTWL